MNFTQITHSSIQLMALSNSSALFHTSTIQSTITAKTIPSMLSPGVDIVVNETIGN